MRWSVSLNKKLAFYQYLCINLPTSSASGVGVGSNPTTALVLVALLTVFRFAEDKIKEVIMNKKLKNSKSKVRVVKRFKSNLVLFLTHLFENVWAIGAGVAGAMAFSTSTH